MLIDASKFLAQSQSRISFAPSNDPRQGDDRARRQTPGGWRVGSNSRRNLPRPPNPYQPTSSQVSGFPFASRLNPQQAPLFYSATDEFREENDEEEHEREIADFYALQRSRRQLGDSGLKQSSEAGDGSGSSLDGSDRRDGQAAGVGRTGGIRSSWRGGLSASRAKAPQVADVSESVESGLEDSELRRVNSNPMVDIGLESTMRSEPDDEPPDDLLENPPSVQFLRKGTKQSSEGGYDSDDSGRDTGHDRLLGPSAGALPQGDSVPEVVPSYEGRTPRHDAFFAHLYLLGMAGMVTTWFIVFLHTTKPKQPMGDTIYTTLHGSFHLLATYTVVSIFLSLLWLAALRAYVRYLAYSIIVAVPVILYSFSLYPLISSYQGAAHGGNIQDYFMRWGSLIPFGMATLWVIACIRGRLAMQKAISILEFATRILAANPALVLVGFATLGILVGFTWTWLSMFTRVFLGGHPVDRSAPVRFVIDASTWWVGFYFILMYLWTIAQVFGFQRTITAATVSQWYFHRLVLPAPTSQTIVKAALKHSSTTLFGTISLFTGMSLLVRLPLLVLPRRLTMLLGVALYSMIPSPIAVLINPLTLTYSAIHSQPLRVSARGLSQMHFLVPSDTTTSLHPNTFNTRRRDGWSADTTPLLPYRLAKLLLHSTRFMMSLALGFGGWVTTARSMKLANVGVKGSLYAYIVGLIAGAIGWSILGAMEGILACVVDAVVVCWGSEVGSSGQGEARYCREAGFLFSDDESFEPGRVSLA